MSKTTFAQTIAALEEFEEQVSSEIAAEQPTDGDFEGNTAGVNFQEEDSDIDDDVSSITEAAQGLEDIIGLVEEAPGECDAPMEPFVEKAVNVALESNDAVDAAGNPVSGDEKSKGEVLQKIKDFAAKVWKMLRDFGKKIAEWVRETWTHMTDRIVRNTTTAQKILDGLEGFQIGANAKITDKGLLGKIAAYKGAEVGEVMQSVAEYVKDQGGKDAEGLTFAARAAVQAVATGGEKADSVIEQFVQTLAKAAGSYDEDATPEQAQALKGNAAGTKTLVTKPFFGGYRAWVTYPENAEALKFWNHGISKVDEVKPADSVQAPDENEIRAIAKFVIDLGSMVKVYQASLKNLDDLNKDLDSAAGKSTNEKTESKQLRAMQAVIPRIIKGPQVAAYAYAASASTVAIQYLQAGLAAHRGEKGLGEKAGDAASAAGKSVSDAAGAAKDKVKGAFAK